MTKPHTGTLATPRILEPVEFGDQTIPRVDLIIRAARGGLNLTETAALADIPLTTLSQWVDRGQQAIADHQTALDATTPDKKQATPNKNPNTPPQNPPTIPETEQPYARLARELTRAGAIRKLRLTGVIDQAASAGDWRAATRALEAQETGSWAPRANVQVTGPNGGPITQAVLLDHTQVVQLAGPGGVLAQRRAAIEGVEVPGGDDRPEPT